MGNLCGGIRSKPSPYKIGIRCALGAFLIRVIVNICFS